ncbi:S8 family serine peptidase [Streptomyces sp. 4N509B]|uniref:S8 family serine peptidase n=1 Tax=Streptomyces sp. 4N509B TaxID=3457413 RepID=UPI003FD5F1C0
MSLRRRPRAALAAGLAASLAVTAAAVGAGSLLAAAPAQAADVPLAENEKLGAHDVEILAEAREDGDRFVTVMLATEPGETEAVAERMDSVAGSSVAYTEDSVGYVRATVRTGKAEAAIAAATGIDAVHAIDLGEEIEIPDPVPASEAGDRATVTQPYPGPGEDTPTDNPYMPTDETGAVEFVEDNPRADGRGITIGVIDTGVDIDHPALQETTTGERKIVDWVTATDPIWDGDGTWRAMVTERSGESFEYNGRQYTAPAGDHLLAVFREEITAGGEAAGDVNRDGDTNDSWALLYDAGAGTVRVDVADDGDFTNDPAMSPYRENHDLGYFGTDDPATAVAEHMPFVVEIREDVPMDPYGGDWVGQVRDFVNIGIVADAHGTHVAGITAANGMFGGEMNGAAPGAKIVSARACAFPSCSSTALTEGMIDLVTNRGVDVVNMSIGGLPPLNDGQSARDLLYNELIDTYGVQMFISAGNEGPGTNTIGAPSTAERVVSVGAAISRETWAANYGSHVERRYALLPFSSNGPRDDGGFKPNIVAPGSAISTTPTWQAGSPVPEAGYELPPGYAMFNGTSMSSPQAAGAAALLLSAAKARDIDLSPDTLRTALTSSADPIPGVQAHEQGSGRFDTEGAWRLIRQAAGGAAAHDYAVSAPVDHVLDQELVTPGAGPGVYDRESAPAVGERERYEVTVTRTTGPDRRVPHRVELVNNDDRTFRLVGSSSVSLPLDQPVTLTLEAKPRSLGAHSVILTLDDGRTTGVDHQILNTVVVAEDLADPSFARDYAGEVQRNDSDSYFVRVPEGTRTLEVAMGGLTGESQTRWIAIDPYGVPAEDTASNLCYPNYNPGNACRPDLRTYSDPLPGVWEIEVESRRTSPELDNPYTVAASALGVTFDPETATIEEAQTGTPSPVSWEVTNDFAPIEGGLLEAGQLGSARSERASIEDGAYDTTRTVEVPAGATEFSVSLGNAADLSADLDLFVYYGTGEDMVEVGASTTPTSEELVVVTNPEAGTYTVEIHGYEVPSGATEFDYQDAYLSPDLGTITVSDEPVSLGNGESAEVGAEVTVTGAAAADREFLGSVRLLNAAGSPAGSATVVIGSVAP